MAAKYVCDNCFEEFPWEPVRQGGETFCCEGCAQGGPCICTYDGPPPSLNGQPDSEATEPSPAVEEAPRREATPAPPAPKAEAKAYTGGPHVCDNCFEEFSWEPYWSNGKAYCCSGCAQGGPCVCTYDGPPPEFRPVPSAPTEEEPEPAPAPAEAVPAAVAGEGEEQTTTVRPSLNGRGKVRVIAEPLPTALDVKMFLIQMEELPDVQEVALLSYREGRAIYEVRVPELNALVKALMEMTYFHVRGLRLTEEGIEVVLDLPRPVQPQAVEARPAVPTAATTPQLPEEVAQALQSVTPTGAPRSGPDEELHPFRYQMGVDVFFNARHQVEIKGMQGPIHSHSWRVQAVIESEARDATGMVVGFDEVREILEGFVSKYNGQFMNRIPPFDEVMPTAENVAWVIYDHVADQLKDKGVRLQAVRVWETPTSYVEYRGDGPST